MNINVFSYFDDENCARHPLVIIRKNYERVANLLYWMEHYAPITSIQKLFQILQNTLIKSSFACDASDIFHRRTFSRDTKSFAPDTTSCRFSVCSLRQAPITQKSNLTSTNIVLRHRSSSMRTLSSSLSHPIAKLSTPLTPSSTKYVLQQPFLPRDFITLTNGP